MNLWGNYKEVLHDTLDLQFAHPWADWEAKGTVLSAKVFKHDYISSQELWRFGMKSLAYTTTSSILRQAVIFHVLVWILWDSLTRRSLLYLIFNIL